MELGLRNSSVYWKQLLWFAFRQRAEQWRQFWELFPAIRLTIRARAKLRREQSFCMSGAEYPITDLTMAGPVQNCFAGIRHKQTTGMCQIAPAKRHHKDVAKLSGSAVKEGPLESSKRRK